MNVTCKPMRDTATLKKDSMKFNVILILLIFPIFAFGQNKSLMIGLKENGLVIGNSKKCNGLRLNLWDKNVDRVNGINFSAKTASNNANGLSFGLVTNQDTATNGFRIGGFTNLGENINGVCIGGLGTAANKINGLGIGGLLTYADRMNGLFISGLGAFGGNGPSYITAINGVSIGMFTTCSNMNGLSFGFQSVTDTTRGLVIGFVYNGSKDAKGVQIGMHNKTEDLHGLQIGFWNIAENNRYFKRTPIINFNFRRKASR
jgi:hypothetical protein